MTSTGIPTPAHDMRTSNAGSLRPGWHAGGINRYVRRKPAYMPDLGMTKCHVLHDTAGKVMIMDGWVRNRGRAGSKI